jgi:acyl-CoA oxidase
VGLFAELRDAMHSMRTHRSDAYNRLVLPRSLELLEAIGARMAFDAAVTKGVHATVLDLFVASIVKRESAWFAEKASLSRATQHNMEADAIDALYPRLPQIVEELDMAPYVSAPILSNDAWRQYVSTLKTFTGPSPIRHVTYVSPPAMSAKL